MDPDAVSPDEFEELVERAIEALPDWVTDAVGDVAFLVADEPTREEQPPDRLLLGRFHGVPATAPGGPAPGVLPPTIVLFRRPILTVCADRDEVAERVALVVKHEIGHALGMGEQRLRDLGVH